MERTTFEKSIVDGFRSHKVDSIAMTSNGRRMFVGTSDGSMVLYECKPDIHGSSKYSCAVLDTIRRASKDKKTVGSLSVVESWRTLLGIIDGVLMAYDSQFYQLLGSVGDVKSCHMYAVNEARRSVLLASKKKLLLYSWQAPGFAFRREFSLSDVPRSLTCVRDCAVLGFKRHYECLDVLLSSSGVTARVLDVEREHRTLCVQLPAHDQRPDAVLLSVGQQGVALEVDRLLSVHGSGPSVAPGGGLSSHGPAGSGAGAAFSYAGAAAEERLQWAAVPVAARVVSPFILSLLGDGTVQVHDLAGLLPLQRLSLGSASPQQGLAPTQLSLCACLVDVAVGTGAGALGGMGAVGAGVGGAVEYAYVCTGEQLLTLKMVSISVQVDALAAAGRFEEAIGLCALCSSSSSSSDYTRGVDVEHLHDMCARQLLRRGDFERAMEHFLLAGTDLVAVLALFPDFLPAQLRPRLSGLLQLAAGSQRQQPALDDELPLEGAAFERAAAALVHYCDFQRPRMMRRVRRARALLRFGSKGQGGMDGGGARVARAAENDRPNMGWDVETDAADNDVPLQEPEVELERAELLDTVLLTALVMCEPSRRAAAVQLLASPEGNYCQVESCAVLLASQGNPYTEALLWLYRSHGQHSRVLEALKEDKSVAVGGWNRDQFYQWSADYLRWLWYYDGAGGGGDGDVSGTGGAEQDSQTLPRQALHAMAPLLEYDAELGLSVLLCHPAGSDAQTSHGGGSGRSSFGGKGLAISEVIAFLRAVQPRPPPVQSARRAAAPPFGPATSSGGSSSSWRYAALVGSAAVEAVVACTPLLNGHALAVAFLECIVSSGDAPESMHDEYAQLLLDGLPSDAQLEAALEEQQGQQQGPSAVAQLHAANDLRLRPDGAAEGGVEVETLLLYRVYRQKLQQFLQNSEQYHPQRVMRALAQQPQYLHERALVLSRLGRHSEVLALYVYRLQDLALAEQYCLRIHSLLTNTQAHGQAPAMSSSQPSNPAALVTDPGEIFLVLFNVLLEPTAEWEEWEEERLLAPADPLGAPAEAGSAGAAARTSLGAEQRLQSVVELAQRHFARVDPVSVLEALPPHTPVAKLVCYLQAVLEYGGAKKRNLQIIHQLLRVREVQMRSAAASHQQVPAAAASALTDAAITGAESGASAAAQLGTNPFA